ncbi:MAG: inositol monophosphatase family protein [Halocynthiibacter sp.]
MIGSANLNVMIKAARTAGRSLLKDFGEVENLLSSMKTPGDFVSRADTRSEEIIKEILMESRPTYGFLAEEGGEVEGKDPTRRWIVDPLDGTTNFLHGLPHWAVSIALEHKGEVISAVVYDPVKDEMFFAEKGAGAWLNDRQRVRTSQRKSLIEGLFATGLPFAGRADLPNTLAELARLLPACAGVRRMGAASLDLAYLGAGRYDGFWERKLKIWDIAAGYLIAKEAGALVEPIRENRSILEDGEIIAANDLIFSKFAKVIRDTGK